MFKFSCDKPRNKGYIASDFTNRSAMIDVNKHTADFISDRRSDSKYSFAIDNLYESMSKDKKNLRKDLDRLRDKGAILNIRRGFIL
jgi:hypothetical protein